jgi:hypothetical protein
MSNLYSTEEVNLSSRSVVKDSLTTAIDRPWSRPTVKESLTVQIENQLDGIPTTEQSSVVQKEQQDNTDLNALVDLEKKLKGKGGKV